MHLLVAGSWARVIALTPVVDKHGTVCKRRVGSGKYGITDAFSERMEPRPGNKKGINEGGEGGRGATLRRTTSCGSVLLGRRNGSRDASSLHATCVVPERRDAALRMRLSETLFRLAVTNRTRRFECTGARPAAMRDTT